jgi:hypothetical protein
MTLKMIMHAKGSNMILGEARVAPTDPPLQGLILFLLSLVLTTWYPHPPPPLPRGIRELAGIFRFGL